MRIDEIIQPAVDSSESNLITALELVRNRYRDKNQPPKINTDSLINLVLNTDTSFNYQALVSAIENNPTVKNLIKNYNKNFIEINPSNNQDDKDTEDMSSQNNVDIPTDTVDNMAKRAAKQRGAAIS